MTCVCHVYLGEGQDNGVELSQMAQAPPDPSCSKKRKEDVGGGLLLEGSRESRARR